MKDKLLELRDMVNEQASLTKNQLDAIKIQNPLPVVISLVLSIGLVYWLKIAIYWVPASLMIMYLWGLKGLVSSGKSFETNKVEKTIEIKKSLKKEQISYGVDWFFLNISNFAKATSIIYGISLFILLAINQKWIAVGETMNMFWPILSMIIYLPLPFLLRRTSIFIKNAMDTPFEFLENVRNTFGRGGLSFILGIVKVFFVAIVLLGSILAPIIALIKTVGVIDDWLFFLLVVVLQFISIMILSSYFSSLTASRQLTNTITNYADINYQINNLLLSENKDDNKYRKLKRLYLTAKPYDILIDDSMQYLHFYYLIMNRTYVVEVGGNSDKK